MSREALLLLAFALLILVAAHLTGRPVQDPKKPKAPVDGKADA